MPAFCKMIRLYALRDKPTGTARGNHLLVLPFAAAIAMTAWPVRRGEVTPM
jgi:hypothetical protein